MSQTHAAQYPADGLTVLDWTPFRPVLPQREADLLEQRLPALFDLMHDHDTDAVMRVLARIGAHAQQKAPEPAPAGPSPLPGSGLRGLVSGNGAHRPAVTA